MYIHCSRKAEPVRPSRALIGYHAVSMNSTASEVCQNCAVTVEPSGDRPICYGFATRGLSPSPRKLSLWLLLNQHQPTPLSEFLRHVKDTRLGAPSIGAYGENGFSRKKNRAQPLSATRFGPPIGGTMLEFF